jgi:hypothetical protein
VSISPPIPPSEPKPLDLSLPEEVVNQKIDFARALDPARSRWLEQKPLLQVRIVDRSLGGRLQRMAKAAVCAELRQAAANARLSGDGSSLEVIGLAMRERGCF